MYPSRQGWVTSVHADHARRRGQRMPGAGKTENGVVTWTHWTSGHNLSCWGTIRAARKCPHTPKDWAEVCCLPQSRPQGGAPGYKSHAKMAFVLGTWFLQSVTPMAPVNARSHLGQVTGDRWRDPQALSPWASPSPVPLPSPHFSGRLGEAPSGFGRFPVTVRVIAFRLLLLCAPTKVTAERGGKCWVTRWKATRGANAGGAGRRFCFLPHGVLEVFTLLAKN